MTRRLVLATRNEHKVHELQQILATLVDELGLEVVGAGDIEGAPDVAETEVTFLGNARLKAVALAEAMALVDRLFGDGRREVDYEFIPTAVFTHPNVGTCGLTEAAARRKFDDDVTVTLPEEIHTGSPREAFCPESTATSRPQG